MQQILVQSSDNILLKSSTWSLLDQTVSGLILLTIHFLLFVSTTPAFFFKLAKKINLLTHYAKGTLL